MTDADDHGPGQAGEGSSVDPLDLLFSAPAEHLGAEEDTEPVLHVPVVVTGPTAPPPPAGPGAADPSLAPPVVAPDDTGAVSAPVGPTPGGPAAWVSSPPPPGSAPVAADAEPAVGATGALWGPRPHPAPVVAPPPPLPLDAPAPAAGAPAGTAGPGGGPRLDAGDPGPRAASPDLETSGPAAPLAPRAADRPEPPGDAGAGRPRAAGDGGGIQEGPPEPPPIPARPSHPRVRRWFGRGATDPDPQPPLTGATEANPPTAPAGGTGRPAPSAPPTAGREAPPVAPVGDAANHPEHRAPAPGPLPVEPVAPPEPDLGTDTVDPWGLEPAAGRLSAGARRAGAVALGIVTTLLVDGERVEAVVQGEYQHHAAIVALTRSRLLIVNDRHWVPDVRSVLLDDQLVVQGWQDDRAATLAFAAGGRSIVVSGIVDRPLARDLARRARELSGGPDPTAAG